MNVMKLGCIDNVQENGRCRLRFETQHLFTTHGYPIFQQSFVFYFDWSLRVYLTQGFPAGDLFTGSQGVAGCGYLRFMPIMYSMRNEYYLLMIILCPCGGEILSRGMKGNSKRIMYMQCTCLSIIHLRTITRLSPATFKHRPPPLYIGDVPLLSSPCSSQSTFPSEAPARDATFQSTSAPSPPPSCSPPPLLLPFPLLLPPEPSTALSSTNGPASFLGVNGPSFPVNTLAASANCAVLVGVADLAPIGSPPPSTAIPGLELPGTATGSERPGLRCEIDVPLIASTIPSDSSCISSSPSASPSPLISVRLVVLCCSRPSRASSPLLPPPLASCSLSLRAAATSSSSSSSISAGSTSASRSA